MKLPLSWLREWVDWPREWDAHELARRLTFVGLRGRGDHAGGAGLQRRRRGAHRQSVEPHPQADKLQVCRVTRRRPTVRPARRGAADRLRGGQCAGRTGQRAGDVGRGAAGRASRSRRPDCAVSTRRACCARRASWAWRRRPRASSSCHPMRRSARICATTWISTMWFSRSMSRPTAAMRCRCWAWRARWRRSRARREGAGRPAGCRAAAPADRLGARRRSAHRAVRRCSRGRARRACSRRAARGGQRAGQSAVAARAPAAHGPALDQPGGRCHQLRDARARAADACLRSCAAARGTLCARRARAGRAPAAARWARDRARRGRAGHRR